MTGEFDPLKAAGEELAGLVDVHKVLHSLARNSEKQLAEAEAEHNAMIKTEQFVADLVEKQRERVNQLRAEAEAKGGGQ